MKKKLLLVSSLITISSLLSSCFLFEIFDEEDTGTEETGNYVIKDIKLYSKNEVKKTVKMRFYNDSPNVPFIGVKQYFTEFFKSTPQMTISNDVYSFYRYTNAYIKVDAKNDKFTILNNSALGNHPDYGTSSSKSFIMDEEGEVSGTVDRVIDLKNYSIAAYGGTSDAYVPLQLMSDFVAGDSLYTVLYNGQNLYTIDMQGMLGDEITIDSYGSQYYSVLKQPTRKSDVAQYSYNLLCLTFDNARGETEQMIFGDSRFRSLGLDSLLETYYPKIKNWLLSTSSEDYQKGIRALFAGLYDGGHTGILGTFPSSSALIQLESDEEVGGIVEEYLRRVGAYSSESNDLIKLKKEVFSLQNDEDKYYRYNDEYKTAYIGFDSFDYAFNAWDDYYKGKREVPVDTDTYAYIRSKLYQAKTDGARNVILDVSTNGGGSIATALGIVALFNKAKSTYRVKDTLNNTKYSSVVKIDTNLDGKYDSKDLDECNKFNFNIAVLTSNLSFSCGNLLPISMKEIGHSIVGEQSGGGSCSITVESTVDGVFYVRSSNSTVSDQYWNNVDGGATLNLDLVDVDGEGNKTYDKFYDFKTIAEYLDNK